MKALEQDINTESSFIILDNEKADVTLNAHQRTKNRVLEHVRNGTDVILVTSAKHSSEPVCLERYFNDNNDEVRTICLSNDSFGSQSSEQSIDLSMISAVVYESIHLDTHFAIIVDNADQFPIQPLNELIKLAISINTSKNNVNFIFTGGPDLLGVIQQISNITRLSLAHCSLDEISQEDIQDFIDLKQNKFTESPRLQFNKYVLKKITTLANGSLHNASIILEWIRLYSLHTDKHKVTVGLLDELIDSLENTNLLSNYPPHGYQFASSPNSTIPTDEENIEFIKHEQTDEQPQIEASQSKTVYIESSEPSVEDDTSTSNVYEKVMGDTTQNDIAQADIPQTDTSVVETEAENPIEIEVVLEQRETNPETKQETHHDSEYTDTYHLDALEHINDPFPYADEDLPLSSATATPTLITQPAKKSGSNKLVVSISVLIICVVAGYFAWTHQLLNETTIKSLIPNIFNTEKTLIHSREIIEDTKNVSPTNSNVSSSEPIEDNHTTTIEALIELANQQIADKKLTTPANDNAYETFNLILEFQPNNKAALAGIEKIKNRYQTWAELDINEGKIKRAKYFLSRAIEISPNDNEVKRLLSSLEQTKPLMH